MVLTQYFVSIETRDTFPTDEYLHISGQLASKLHEILGDLELFRRVTNKECTNARVEVEINQNEEEKTISAQILVQAEAPSKFPFNKTTFAAILKEALPFVVSVTKRAVTKEEMAQAA